jgi:hypothetical protein
MPRTKGQEKGAILVFEEKPLIDPLQTTDLDVLRPLLYSYFPSCLDKGLASSFIVCQQAAM